MTMKKNPQNDPTWLDLQNAHTKSSFSVSELRRLCITGDIESATSKPGKTRGHRLIKASSLDAYIQSFMPGGSRYQKHLGTAK